MRKRIIALLSVAGLVLSHPTTAQVLQLRPDAPDRYVVKKDDTLWSISNKYLFDPWNWPELWKTNQADIDEPHWIYPGQVLLLDRNSDRPRLVLGSSAEINPVIGEQTSEGTYLGREQDGVPIFKAAPRIREVSTGKGIATVDVDLYRLFMRYPHVVDSSTLTRAPRIVAGSYHSTGYKDMRWNPFSTSLNGGEGQRQLFANGDVVFGYGDIKPGRYLSYHVVDKLYHPKTNQFLGYTIIFNGTLTTIKSDGKDRSPNSKVNVTPLLVTGSIAEIQKGSYLMPLDDRFETFAARPHAPEKSINADVIYVTDAIANAGPFSTITLNKGLKDGIDEGTVLSIYEPAKQVLSQFSDDARRQSGTSRRLWLPAIELGLAMVYKADDNISSAIILGNPKSSISIGNIASNPGQNLEYVPASRN